MTKQERQERDRAATKCWCGNVAGLGQTLCGAHRDETPDPLANIPDPAAYVAAFEGMREALEGCIEYLDHLDPGCREHEAACGAFIAARQARGEG